MPRLRTHDTMRRMRAHHRNLFVLALARLPEAHAGARRRRRAKAAGGRNGCLPHGLFRQDPQRLHATHTPQEHHEKTTDMRPHDSQDRHTRHKLTLRRRLDTEECTLTRSLPNNADMSSIDTNANTRPRQAKGTHHARAMRGCDAPPPGAGGAINTMQRTICALGRAWSDARDQP
jgi:hypothetical protein